MQLLPNQVKRLIYDTHSITTTDADAATVGRSVEEDGRKERIKCMEKREDDDDDEEEEETIDFALGCRHSTPHP